MRFVTSLLAAAVIFCNIPAGVVHALRVESPLTRGAATGLEESLRGQTATAVSGSVLGEKISFQGVSGPVDIWFSQPQGVGTYPTVLFFPGFSDSAQNPIYARIVPAFVQEGYAIALVDFSQGSGKPIHFSPRQELDDAAEAYEVLSGKNLINGPVVTAGYSFGGFLALWVAALASRGDARFASWPPIRGVARFSSTIDPGATSAHYGRLRARSGKENDFTGQGLKGLGQLTASTLASLIPPNVRLVEMVGEEDEFILGGEKISGPQMGEFQGRRVFSATAALFQQLERRGTPVEIYNGLRHGYLHGRAPEGIIEKMVRHAATRLRAGAGMEEGGDGPQHSSSVLALPGKSLPHRDPTWPSVSAITVAAFRAKYRDVATAYEDELAVSREVVIFRSPTGNETQIPTVHLYVHGKAGQEQALRQHVQEASDRLGLHGIGVRFEITALPQLAQVAQPSLVVQQPGFTISSNLARRLEIAGVATVPLDVALAVEPMALIAAAFDASWVLRLQDWLGLTIHEAVLIQRPDGAWTLAAFV
ncbi:MAG: hypothetical protein HY594_01270 [Candidatus Omnitrophica bacterium]|nr:hypothetical protein [Candidatus Omnitrophota bacterium]